MDAARKVLTIMKQKFTTSAEPHSRGFVELSVAGVVYPTIDDHARRVHALGDQISCIRNVLSDEGLDANAADVLFPGIHTETVELPRRNEVEEMAHEHLTLGTVEINLFAESQATAQRPAPQHLRIIVRNIEIGTELATATCSDDAVHVDPEFLICTFGRFKHERRFIPPLERQLFQAANVVSVRVRSNQVLNIVNRKTELRHFQGRFRSQIHEQSDVAFDDDDVRLKHLGRKGSSDTQEEDPQTTTGGQRQFGLVFPDSNSRSDEHRLIRTKLQNIALEHN